MTDLVFDNFLKTQCAEGTQLAAASDVLDLMPHFVGARAPNTYVARFACVGVLRSPNEEPRLEAGTFQVGIRFPDDYLRHVQPMQIITWLGPQDVFSPHIAASIVCCGRIETGTSLVDLIYRCYEIISFTHIVAPHDALNPDAATWARQHQELFPTDRRPLKRRPKPTAKEVNP